MRVFISFASEDRPIAEDIHLALTGVGFETFFDRVALPTAREYHGRIQAAVGQSDVFIFLASPDSVKAGTYAVTELKYAQEKWRHPDGYVVPVRIRGVPWDAIPVYLRAVTVLEPQGNVPAEVLHTLSKMKSAASSGSRSPSDLRNHSSKVNSRVVGAIVGSAVAVVAALVATSAFRSIFPRAGLALIHKPTVAVPPSSVASAVNTWLFSVSHPNATGEQLVGLDTSALPDVVATKVRNSVGARLSDSKARSPDIVIAISKATSGTGRVGDCLNARIVTYDFVLERGNTRTQGTAQGNSCFDGGSDGAAILEAAIRDAGGALRTELLRLLSEL
jgi:TIR domain